MEAYLKIFKIFLSFKGMFRFCTAVVVGVSFSMAVILCTIGLMDGFVETFHKGLQGQSGQFYFYSDYGFFEFDDSLKENLRKIGSREYAQIVQTQAFVVGEGQSSGVLVYGINPTEYSNVVSTKIESLKKNEIVIGEELAKRMGLKVGDNLVLALAKGNQNISELPLLQSFKVSSIINHGIFEKNLRSVYLNLFHVQNLLKLNNRINLVMFNGNQKSNVDYNNYAEEIKKDFYNTFESHFSMRTFWQEYSSILSAVETEKFMMGLILQLIVVIAVINVLAFLIFIREEKAREIFLLRALGATLKTTHIIWYSLMGIIWLFSSVLSLAWLKIFNFLLGNVSFFRLPPDIYHLTGTIQLNMSGKDYFLVYGISLLWIYIICWFGLLKYKKLSVLHGLRREFV
ncbi:MAG: ABC transporter permease [Halobacteriovoraceae bacterium]|nr:ABC transporter permease [Halobacteriovoraceae bacterium]